MEWPIEDDVFTTAQRQVFPIATSEIMADTTSQAVNVELLVQLTPEMQESIANVGVLI